MDERARRLAELEAHARDLDVLNSFSRTLLRYDQDIDDILWDLANQAVARLGLEDCVIYLVDPARGDLVQRAAYGPKNPREREIKDPIRIPLGRGIVGSVAATRRTERIADTRQDPRYILDDEARLSELAVPLLHGDELLGVLDSEHRAADFFTDWHEQVFTTLAAMASARIVKARLDESLTALNASLERLVAERTAELRAEQEVTERLLRNVLPEPVARRLQAGERRVAERLDGVAVLFADVVGFTGMTRGCSPEQVLTLLEQLFTRFDALSELAGVEKVKTIGDAWMAVCGAPLPHPDALGTLMGLAVDLVTAAADLRDPQGLPVAVRVGLHQGPVVAGILGTRKFAWDLWGETVNLASRLESQGVPGRVHVLSELVPALGGRFVVEERGWVELKGLGTRRTALVQARAAAPRS